MAILQETTCLTVMTWNQFVPRLAEFGRTKLPRKWGRLLRRLTGEPLTPDATWQAHGDAGLARCAATPGIDLGAKPRITRQGACSST